MQDDGWGHHGANAFAGRAHVEAIRMQIGFAEDVVEDESRAIQDITGCFARSGGQGNEIAVIVEHAEMRGVLMFVINRRVGRIGPGGPGKTVGQIVAVFPNMIRRQEDGGIAAALERRPGEVGLAHHFGKQSQMFSASKGQLLQIIGFEQGQGESDERSSTRWRRIGEDTEITVGHLQRFAYDYLVESEVFGSEQPAIFSLIGQNLLSNIATVEKVRAFDCQGFKRIRQLRIAITEIG